MITREIEKDDEFLFGFASVCRIEYIEAKIALHVFREYCFFIEMMSDLYSGEICVYIRKITLV